MLLLASYFFYMMWSPPFALLLLGSTLLDYTAGNIIAKTPSLRTKKLWVLISCVGNLGVLSFFKYGAFITENVWNVIPALSDPPAIFTGIILPVGISFYTFQSLSYTIDVYRDSKLKSDSFLDFALYVSFFPQLVAGPIVRAGTLLPQFREKHNPNSQDIMRGIDLIARGFAKKILIADTLAIYVDMVYANPDFYGAVNQLVAIYAYAFQIYMDFSGYSDIAIGSALLLGFKLPENFRLPYMAQSPSDFWRRWHISLSTWLRDYLYISLGGSRSSNLKTYRNLLITMVLGGLWHGAAWGFVLWGCFHGLWLAIHRILCVDNSYIKIPKWLSIFITFHLVCFGWICFRAPSWDVLTSVITQFANFSIPVYAIPLDVLVCLGLAFLSHLLGSVTFLVSYWNNLSFVYKVNWYALLTVVIFFRASAQQQFIYFQF